MDAVSRKQLEEANKAYAMGKFTEAEMLYRKAGTGAVAFERLGSIALWRNDTQAAERYFTEAMRALPLYQRFWPLTAMLHYRLAMTYYRRDRFAEASCHLLKAAGPVGFGPFGEMKALGRHAALLAGDVTYAIEGPEQSRASFIKVDPLPVLQVSVCGREPVNFIVDTGGAEVILDNEYASEVGALMAGAFTASYAGHKKGKTGVGRIDSLQIGELVIRNVPIHTLDVASISPTFGVPLHGIIGTRLLMHFLATIDYAGGALILQRRTTENLRKFEAQALADGARVTPFWLVDTHYILTTGTVNGHEPTLLFLDTGLEGGGFTATETDLTAYGIKVDWTKTTEGVGGGGKIESAGFVVDRLTIGTGVNEIERGDVSGAAIKNSVPVLGDVLGFHIGGLISHQFFRPYALTLDFTGMRLFIV